MCSLLTNRDSCYTIDCVERNIINVVGGIMFRVFVFEKQQSFIVESHDEIVNLIGGDRDHLQYVTPSQNDRCCLRLGQTVVVVRLLKEKVS